MSATYNWADIRRKLAALPRRQLESAPPLPQQGGGQTDAAQESFLAWIATSDNPIRGMGDAEHPLPVAYSAGYAAGRAAVLPQVGEAKLIGYMLPEQFQRLDKPGIGATSCAIYKEQSKGTVAIYLAPVAQALPVAADWEGIRRKLAALPRRQIESAPGIFDSYVSQSALLDVFDSATQGNVTMSTDTLNDVCHIAASTLPEGYSIKIQLEQGYGGVTLFDPNCGALDFSDQRESLSSSMEKAIAFAIEYAAKEPK